MITSLISSLLRIAEYALIGALRLLPPLPAESIVVPVGKAMEQPRPTLERTVAMNPTMTNTQFRILGPIVILNALGGPASIDPANPPTWTASDPTLASLEPSADGLSCKVNSVGGVGTVDVVVTVDADLGEGVRPVAQTTSIDITQAGADHIQVPVGDAQERPPSGG